MGGSLTLFRFMDIDVRVHWSFLLILVYGAFLYGRGPNAGAMGAIYGVIVILLLFVFVLLHEFGHAITAKYFKVNVPYITLLPIGGVAQLERMPDKPYQEFLITVAGPLVNFVLALILLPFAAIAVSLEMRSGGMGLSVQALWNEMQTPSLTGLLINLTVTNITLGIFNLLPAFPMDGGRILRSLLAFVMPYIRATRIAVFVGRGMAVLFAFWGITGNIFMLLIAFFVYLGGRSELEAVESRAVLRHIPVSEAMNPGAISLYASERLKRAVELIMTTYQADFAVMDLSNRFVGVLTRARLVRALREEGEEGRVVDVMAAAKEIPTCSINEQLSEVWEKMIQSRSRVVAVTERGRFLGLLTLEDISEVIEVQGARMERDEQRLESDDQENSPASLSQDG